MPNVDAKAAQRVINENWVVEGDTVSARLASLYRMGAAPMSAIASVRREVAALDPKLADKIWKSFGVPKDPAAEAAHVAEVARLEQAGK